MTGEADPQSTSVVIPLRFGKRPAGFALVTYDKEEDAAKAVEQLQDKGMSRNPLAALICLPSITLRYSARYNLALTSRARRPQASRAARAS